MRIFQTGFETGNKTQLFSTNALDSLDTSPTRGAWSTYSLQVASTAGAAIDLLPTSLSEFYCGFGLYHNDAVNAIIFQSPNAVNQCSIATDAGGHLKVTKGTHSGTIQAIGTSVLAINTWYYIEVHIVISASVGQAQVKLDGITEIALTGSLDTKGDAASGVIDRFHYTSGDGHFDDVYINDTTGSVNNGFSGDIRIQALIPNAVGDSTGFTRGGSDSGSNWGQVDERPPNDSTDYVLASDTTSIDLYNIANPTGLGNVQAVNLWLRAEKDDAGVGSIAHVIKTGAGQDVGPDVALSTSWTYYGKVYDQDPADASNWTATKIDELQIGAKSR